MTHKTIRTKAGRSVTFADGLVPEETRAGLLEYLLQHGGEWRFDGEATGQPPFTSPMSVKLLRNAPFKASIQALVGEVAGTELDLCNAQAWHVRFGEAPRAGGGGPDRRGLYSALLFLNPAWEPSHAGEVVFYDDGGDVEVSVRPRPGRVVIWENGIVMAPRPPAAQFKRALFSLRLDFADAGKTREDAPPPEDATFRGAYERVMGKP